MKDSELLWQRVQCALDGRRDPREDEDVLDAIVADPEALARMEIWLARLESVRTLPRRRPVARVALVAAFVAAACIPIAWLALREPVAPASTSRLISIEWEHSTEYPAQRAQVVVTEREVIARAEFHDATRDMTWSTESNQRLHP